MMLARDRCSTWLVMTFCLFLTSGCGLDRTTPRDPVSVESVARNLVESWTERFGVAAVHAALLTNGVDGAELAVQVAMIGECNPNPSHRAAALHVLAELHSLRGTLWFSQQDEFLGESAVLAGLCDTTQSVRSAALHVMRQAPQIWTESLCRRSQLVPCFASMLDDPSSSEYAAHCLGNGRQFVALPVLLAHASDDATNDPGRSHTVAAILRAAGMIDPKDVRVLALLVRRSTDTDETIASGAAAGLGFACVLGTTPGPDATDWQAEAIDRLHSLLHEESRARVQLAAVVAIGETGPACTPWLPDLLAIGRPGSPVETASLEAISRFGPLAATAVPVLERVVRLRRHVGAVDALGAIGPQAASAAPTIIAYMRSEMGDAGGGDSTNDVDDSEIPWEAGFDALVGMQASGAEVAKVIGEGLGSESGRTRLSAARALGHLGRPDRDAVATFLEVVCTTAVDDGTRRQDRSQGLIDALLGLEARGAPVCEVILEPQPVRTCTPGTALPEVLRALACGGDAE